MENALNLDTVKLAENKKEIVILDQTVQISQYFHSRRYLGSNLFAESKRSSGNRCYRSLCILCARRSD